MSTTVIKIVRKNFGTNEFVLQIKKMGVTNSSHLFKINISESINIFQKQTFLVKGLSWTKPPKLVKCLKYSENRNLLILLA